MADEHDPATTDTGTGDDDAVGTSLPAGDTGSAPPPPPPAGGSTGGSGFSARPGAASELLELSRRQVDELSASRQLLERQTAAAESLHAAIDRVDRKVRTIRAIAIFYLVLTILGILLTIGSFVLATAIGFGGSTGDDGSQGFDQDLAECMADAATSEDAQRCVEDAG